MFDEIIVKKDLPLPEELKSLNIDWKTHKFQTKDLVNCMSEYWISEEGELFEHVVEREYIPYTEQERKQKKVSPWNFWKDVIEKEVREEKQNFHGELKFYTYESIDEDTDFWVDFKAYFIYGKLDKIELIEWKFDKERKASYKEWVEEYKQEQKHPWNRFKHYASYLGWRWFWKKMDKVCCKIKNLFSSIQVFIIRHCL